jgi:hypothetical protein
VSLLFLWSVPTPSTIPIGRSSLSATDSKDDAKEADSTMKDWTMAVALLLSATCAALVSSPAIAKTAKHHSDCQICDGVLTKDGDEYSLNADPSSKSLWCAAVLQGEPARHVLKVCAVRDRCHIEGSFAGHGIFYWTRITKVRKVGQ